MEQMTSAMHFMAVIVSEVLSEKSASFSLTVSIVQFVQRQSNILV